MRLRRTAPPPPDDQQHDQRDEGAALVLVLVLMVVAALIIMPMMSYAMAVSRSNRVGEAKAARVEAVKGGLRTALADPTALYKACERQGVNTGQVLASPDLAVDVKTTCYVMNVSYSEDETKRPYGVSATQANSVLPDFFVNHDTSVPDHYKAGVYPDSGAADPNLWKAATSLTRVWHTIWTPNLPAHALSQRSATPYSMPTEFGNCKVYFPGTYVDPIVINGTTPVYFTSGIYYFENTVTISGNANVVAGGGTVDGCTTDQEAAFYAVNGPATHNITGLGATFVFGMAGRLIVNNSSPGTNLSLIFNQRYVQASDVGSRPSETVNIMSVNGDLPGSDLVNTLVDLDRPGLLSVPYSQTPTTAGALGPATLNKYRPSTLVPPLGVIDPTTNPDTSPIVDIAFSTNSTAKIEVPGYVYVPQGRFRLDIPAGSGFGANKTISFNGGVMARTVELPGDNPAEFSMGVSEVVVQLFLRIKSETTEGRPYVTSDAIVQVNKNGGYAVNSWVVQ